MEVVNHNVCEARHEAVNQLLIYSRRRLDNHDESIEQLQKLTVEIAMLNQQLSNMVQDHETRLRSIELLPVKRWDKLINQIISLLLAATLGGLIRQFMG